MSYVPIHYGPVVQDLEEASDQGSVVEPLMVSDEGESRPIRRRLAKVQYSAALRAHRGCSDCWLRWEELRANALLEAPRSRRLIVRCPVCDLSVDIRRAYDTVLCEHCQSEVVAKGASLSLSLALLRARFAQTLWLMKIALGLCSLGLLFGMQALVSIAVFYFCEQRLEVALAHQNISASVETYQPPPSGHHVNAELVRNFTMQVMSNLFGPPQHHHG